MNCDICNKRLKEGYSYVLDKNTIIAHYDCLKDDYDDIKTSEWLFPDKENEAMEMKFD